MIFHKLTNTLLKGLLLFVLTSSPTANIFITTSPTNHNFYNYQTTHPDLKNNSIQVSAEEKTKSNLPKENYASYTCNENLYKPLLNEINKLRKENDVPKATLDGQLNAVACAHTIWMIKNQKFGHRGIDNTGFASRCLEAGTKCEDESVLVDIVNDLVDVYKKAIGDESTKVKMLDPGNKNIGFGLEEGVLTVIYR
ncbi:MAG: CAP domain-containing protein [candidate division SR1 bacterium]|nr:CAP domain-containing protein [candidate division SR1 bacterium]